MEIPRNSLQKSSFRCDNNSAQYIATILLSTCFFKNNVTFKLGSFSTNELDVKLLRQEAETIDLDRCVISVFVCVCEDLFETLIMSSDSYAGLCIPLMEGYP